MSEPDRGPLELARTSKHLWSRSPYSHEWFDSSIGRSVAITLDVNDANPKVAP